MMLFRSRRWMMILLVLALACSKKEGASEQAANQETAPGRTPAGSGNAPLTPENAPYADVIKTHGYEVVQAKRFPAQVDSRRASVVVYRAKDGARGGVLYVRAFQDDPAKPAWHWYFSDAAPDSAAAADINRDGLWDVRVYMQGGQTREFIQDADFSFTGPERSSLIAMNGESSSPQGLWKVFDADTSTAWTAPAGGAYIDIPNPFGLDMTQLEVRLAGNARPQRLVIAKGTEKIQECDLTSTSEEQRFQLDAAVKTLPVIRINVEGQGRNVAISELALQ